VKHAALALAGLAGGGIAAGVAYERWRSDRSDQLDVYFDDGSFVTYFAGSAAAEQLLPLARQVLAAVQA